MVPTRTSNPDREVQMTIGEAFLLGIISGIVATNLWFRLIKQR